MPELTNEQMMLALAIVAGLTLVSLLIALFLAMRVRKIRREYMVLRGENGSEVDLLRAVGRTRKQVEAVTLRVDELSTAHEGAVANARVALQKFHLVRYDAFEDMGGRLSFSAALLDDHGDGLVITSINGRTETRTYAKPIVNLRSEHNLSDEERAAIAGAAGSQGRGETASAAVR